MVFVPVREQNTQHLITAGIQIGGVWHHQIDAGQVFTRKGDAAVHYQRLPIIANQVQILPDLACATKRDNLYRQF
jgi:hypothetical protein